jgi:pimeloyl-ACP methyl ester carboxylesterase
MARVSGAERQVRRPALSARAHDGSLIELSIHGSGPRTVLWPVVQTAGSPAASLPEDYRVVFFEYPGAPKPRTLTPANVVRDVYAVADAAGVGRFVWCGYSWSAVVGLQLAVDGDRLSGLVCGGWPPLGGPYERMLGAVRGDGPPSTAALSRISAEERQQLLTFYEALQSFDDDAAQRSISCPRLCVSGSADDIYGLGIGATVIKHRDRLEALGWSVRVIDGMDHLDVLRPDVFPPLVGAWLAEHPDRDD